MGSPSTSGKCHLSFGRAAELCNTNIQDKAQKQANLRNAALSRKVEMHRDFANDRVEPRAVFLKDKTNV
ncbi:hypothetical protein [Ruegeria atlantica]|uniref:hypothetical protein n=1 Tax=Ruegeria atlantica TaxID=81569 RepID=UPI001F48434B|nr:hypothetical protein [Ruegeria atlantica]